MVISFLLGDEQKSRSLSVIALLINLVMMYLYFGVIRVLLRMERNESYTWDHLKTSAKTVVFIIAGALLYMVPFAAAAVLLFVVVGPGLLAIGGPIGLGIGAVILVCAIIIAAIIYCVRFGMYYFFIIDKDMKPIAALKASMHATRGSTLRLIAFMVIAIIACVIGALFWGLGLLVVLPMFLLCECAIYERLSKHMSGQSSEFPIVQPAELESSSSEKTAA